MVGITDIKTLLKEINPVLDEAEFVFVTLKQFSLNDDVVKLNPIATFLESEGITAVVPKSTAEQYNHSFHTTIKKITLEVHSSLEAVGLTSAISTALTRNNIPANIIAGYYHDHIFVPKDKATLAMKTLTDIITR